MLELAIFLAPLLLGCAAAVVGVKALASSADGVRENNIPQTLLIALVSLIPVYWLAFQLAGEETAGDGDTCPAINEGVVAVLVISMIPLAAILGGVTVAASLVANPNSLKVGGYVLGGMYVLRAACWLT